MWGRSAIFETPIAKSPILEERGSRVVQDVRDLWVYALEEMKITGSGVAERRAQGMLITWLQCVCVVCENIYIHRQICIRICTYKYMHTGIHIYL